MSHRTYKTKLRGAMDDLKELLQLEQDCVVLPTTSSEVETFYPKVARLYVRYIVVTNAIEACHDNIVHPQERAFVRKVLETLLVRLLEIKKIVIATSPRDGSPHLFIADVLSYLDVSPEQATLRIPRFLKDDLDAAEQWDVKMQKLEYWAATLRANALRTWEAASRIQAVWRAWSCRRRVEKERRTSLVFWGFDFVESDSQSTEEKRLLKQVFATRKLFQKEAEKTYNASLDSELAWLRNNVGSELKARKFEEGRDWMLEFRRQVGSFPTSLADRTKDYDGIPPPPPDGRPYKIGLPGADKRPAAKAKAKAQPAKKPEAGKEKKSTVPEVETPPQTTTDELRDLATDFERHWIDFQSSLDAAQDPDQAIMRSQLLPQVEREVTAEVDELLKQELVRLRQRFDLVKEKRSKRKGQKGAKKAKNGEKNAKKVKCCNAMDIAGPDEDIFPDLVKDGILKAIAPAKLEEFIGNFPVCATPTEEFLPAPTAWQIKQFLVEQIILPLASTHIRERTPFPARSLLLYGPPGSGKSLVARIIATEAGAMFYDISPHVIENLYKQQKTGTSLMIHRTFLSAQQHAPAVIYIDNVDQVFMPKKGGKKKGNGGESQLQSTAWRIRDQLKAHLNLVRKAGGPLSNSDRLLIIGCTSRPFADRLDQKGMSDFFDHKLWLNFPNYETRKMIWENLLQKKHARIETLALANLSTLAEISEGYSSGALEAAVDHVFVDQRIARLVDEPVHPTELIGVLSRLPYCWPEDWLQFREFDFVATGEKARVAARKAKAEAEKAAAEKANRNRK
ncbi:ATPase, AAA family protein [Toxoplasma gondii VEG]|uniref:AAA family ATPase domain-containing protein n=2 Tax=Toxoplasma gondii TaxID=5811 RepID=B9QHW0_TOXGV|nr:ATPase, AAA family protein [Toxoplasma gondii VEG]KFG43226.1 ATPase, AAA family protein [Toxoplasma gondii p89]CEL72623.1 TPA: AAA family ATPase domain-containing protein [Toxoplasma gondii VEG]